MFSFRSRGRVAMSAWYRTLFLFSSFGPLYLVLAFSLYVQHHVVAAGVGAGIVVASFLVFLKLRSGFKRGSVFRSEVDPDEVLDENILNYLIAYLPPLFVDDLGSPTKIVPVGVFYAVTALLLFMSETIYVNPYFLMFRYRVYRMKLQSGRKVVVVTTRRDVVSGEMLNLHEVQPSRMYFGY